MTMRVFWLTLIKDLTLAVRDPIGLLAWVMIPLAITSLLSLISGGGNPRPQGALLVADLDNTLASGAITQLFLREPLNGMIHLEAVSEAIGRKRMDAGQASALLIIPPGFGPAMFLGRRSALTLLTNPAQRIVPAMIQQVLSGALDGAFYLQHGANLAAAPKIDVHYTTIVVEKQTPVSLAVLFYPGMLMLAIFGLGQSMTDDLWKERAHGTLRRALTSRHHLAAFLGGKIAAAATLFLLLAAFGITVAHVALSASAVHAPLAILWCGCAGVGLYMFSAILQVFTADERSGIMINRMMLFVFGMIGGSFFPFEIMPKWMAAIGRLTPNGWFMSRFKAILDGGADLSAFGIFALVAAIAFVALTGRLRRWAI
jgi:ABC-type multidrug transport system permease subunit